ncbi:MAG: hypothetical protein OEP95_14820 [Myxococcales bacterium]|nr:hypothetical protein [Myxococcales bacterium]
MLPIFALIAAALGLLLIVFLILREVGDETEGADKGAMIGASVLVLGVAVWQVIAHLPGGGGAH